MASASTSLPVAAVTKHYSRLGRAGESRSLHEEHLARMRDYYHATAQEYNRWHCNEDDSGTHNRATGEVLRLLSQNQGSRLLDVGCGTGRCIKKALAAGFDAEGVDVSKDLLDVAEREFKIPRHRLHCVDATRLPFPDNSFDVVCILGALHHSAMPHTIISELIRVTRRALVVSDVGNRFAGGIRQLLISLGIFTPVYRLLFRREPKTVRRGVTSEGDGPAFDFTLEEIIPTIRGSFASVRCLASYSFRSANVAGYWLPRLFASHGVIVAEKKRPAPPPAQPQPGQHA